MEAATVEPRFDIRLDTRAIARELLDPQDPRLRALYRRRPLRAALALARCWLVIAAALALVAVRPTLWSVALAFVVVGSQQYALSILSHDGKHRNLFSSPRWNDAVALCLTSAPLGTDFFHERRIHLQHHDRLAHDDDPDRDLYRAADKSEARSFLLYLTAVTTVPGVRQRSPESPRRSTFAALVGVARARWFALPAQALIFALFALGLRWWLYFPLWLAPLFLLMLVPQRIRQFCEHAQAVLPDEAGDSGRLVTYRPGPLERLFLAPMHMGYHAEHHLWPGVPCFNLPRLAALVPRDPRIEKRSGYLAFLRRYFRRLPLAPTISVA